MPVLNTSDSAREALLQELTDNSDLNKAQAVKIIEKVEENFDIAFKKRIISVVIGIFIISVLTLWAGLWWVASKEYELVNSKILSTESRIITEKLLLALIAGTVTQVSLSFGLMIKYLFSKPKTTNK